MGSSHKYRVQQSNCCLQMVRPVHNSLSGKKTQVCLSCSPKGSALLSFEVCSQALTPFNHVEF